MNQTRLRCRKLYSKVTNANQASKFIKDGMCVATSGFTPSGYPKAIPLALAKRIKEDENVQISLLTGASVGNEVDGLLSQSNMINRRYPYQTNKIIRTKINEGLIAYSDIHLSHFPQQIRRGFYKDIDVAVIEATSIDEEGNIIPTTSVGISPTIVKEAKKILVEININKPLLLEGFHDIYTPLDPPNQLPIPLRKPEDRIGKPYLSVDIDKIEAIVETEIEDEYQKFSSINEESKNIANNLVGFLTDEVNNRNLPGNLLPLQSGVGSIANAVLSGLISSPFNNLDIYSEVIQDSVLDLIDSDKINIASGTSLTFSQEGQKRFYDNIEFYKKKIILRPQEISNHPEIIRRIGLISINTALEFDIYGNVNSTNVMGSKIMNGIGGSGDFTRNASLSIFVSPSIIKDGDISCIVPMVSHVDHTEHDVHVIITEQGVADLRGLSPRERASEIINNCAHPSYKNKLLDYYNRALKRGGHTPHLIEEALSWHCQYLNENTMKCNAT